MLYSFGIHDTSYYQQVLQYCLQTCLERAVDLCFWEKYSAEEMKQAYWNVYMLALGVMCVAKKSDLA